MAEEINACGQDGAEEPKLPGADLFDWLQMVMGCILAAVLLLFFHVLQAFYPAAREDRNVNGSCHFPDQADIIFMLLIGPGAIHKYQAIRSVIAAA